MNEEKRNNQNSATAVNGDEPQRVGNLLVRSVSPESLGILDRLGSPFAAVINAALNRQPAPEVQPTAQDLILFAWVHAADPDEVLHTAMQCSPVFGDPAIEASLRFSRAYTMDSLGGIFAAAMGDADAVRAADFDASSPLAASPVKKKG